MYVVYSETNTLFKNIQENIVIKLSKAALKSSWTTNTNGYQGHTIIMFANQDSFYTVVFFVCRFIQLSKTMPFNVCFMLIAHSGFNEFGHEGKVAYGP